MNTAKKDIELKIVRTFDAPRRQVFACWTDPEHMRQWSCPRGFTITHGESDVRVGGQFSVTMRSPEGTDHSLKGVYKEINAPERLVFSHQWTQPGSPETLCTVTFSERSGKTEMTFIQTGFDTTANRDGHHGGWSESFDKMAEMLATS
jgi:uncharacterized protein YndB with AHSA1/START domain